MQHDPELPAIKFTACNIRLLNCATPPEKKQVGQGQSPSLAQTAYSDKEIISKKLKLDIEYYKSQQILPPIIRMLSVFKQYSGEELAKCFKLDTTKYKR